LILYTMVLFAMVWAVVLSMWCASVLVLPQMIWRLQSLVALAGASIVLCGLVLVGPVQLLLGSLFMLLSPLYVVVMVAMLVGAPLWELRWSRIIDDAFDVVFVEKLRLRKPTDSERGPPREEIGESE
jgi:hypothetical protein